MNAAMSHLAALLGDDFYTLVALLPDSFFLLPEEQQTKCWQEALHAFNQGTTRPRELVRIFAEPDGLEAGLPATVS